MFHYGTPCSFIQSYRQRVAGTVEPPRRRFAPALISFTSFSNAIHSILKAFYSVSVSSVLLLNLLRFVCEYGCKSMTGGGSVKWIVVLDFSFRAAEARRRFPGAGREADSALGALSARPPVSPEMVITA